MDTQPTTDSNIAIITHIHTLLDRWIDADMRVEIAPRLLFSEIEPIAVLAVLVGRAELAQDIILAWANGTADAGEYAERLGQWGIGTEWCITDTPTTFPTEVMG